MVKNWKCYTVVYVYLFIFPANVLQEEIEGITQNLENIKQNVTAVPKNDVVEWNGIKCLNHVCSCCAYVEEKEIFLDSTVCVKVKHLSNNFRMLYTVTLDKHTLFNETISALDPPTVEFGFPHVKEQAKVYVNLYDILLKSTSIHACTQVEARMNDVFVAKYELGCFSIDSPEFLGADPDDAYYPTPTFMVIYAGIVAVLIVVLACCQIGAMYMRYSRQLLWTNP
ncbi:uncharacterized protein [Periplaneta americana]|uniref:uncharacterized protein isoform X2 n=1 Tax=Periplaneta americana TaxID=6978 RepID=UPI0037E98C5F